MQQRKGYESIAIMRISVMSTKPTLKSVQEEAEFWDTHDTTDFEDQFNPIRVKLRNMSEGITIRFDSQTLAILREQANDKGVDAMTLARMWVLERLKSEKPHPQNA